MPNPVEIPPHEEVVAVAMLVGDPMPVPCSCCGGARKTRSMFGFRRCGQCNGLGYDLLGTATCEAMGLPAGEYWKVIVK